MKKTALLAILSLTLFSCKQEQKHKPTRAEMLVGEWDLETFHSPNRIVPRYWGLRNFKLYPGDRCESKDGFFTYVDPNEGTEDRNYSRCFFYRGNETTYKVQDSALLIYNRSHERWQHMQIKKLTKNSLLVSSTGIENLFFIRRKKTPIDSTRYDAIIVADRNFNASYLDKRGLFFFNGCLFATRNGAFRGQVPLLQYAKLELLARRIEVAKLKDYYLPRYAASHGTHHSVTLISNGRIYKTIQDTDQSAPVDVHDLYMQVEFLYQNVGLDATEFIAPGFHLGSLFTKDKWFQLPSSEAFYLTMLLHQSKPVKADFTPTYEMTCSQFLKQPTYWSKNSPQPIKVLTDGQHFRILFDDKTQITYDLGYDFIARNGWDQKMKDIPKVSP